ncbi:hypothetical protein [Pseudomonas sp. 2FE]|uniref:hypothetical protein n=1 Tax=Pseudomonas sp. 2FE TaxID=2502190 RepID=UPI0010F9C519|nr:hypothetical protein [Pseudomonas sp. 2FE]
MVDSRNINRILKSPSALAAYMATGRVPKVAAPSSPLITLLQSLYPRERTQIFAVMVSSALGYQGSRLFHNAQQALNWLAPDTPQQHLPSQSWQDRRFRSVLTIDDLAKVAKVPDRVAKDWWSRHPQHSALRGKHDE